MLHSPAQFKTSRLYFVTTGPSCTLCTYCKKSLILSSGSRLLLGLPWTSSLSNRTNLAPSAFYRACSVGHAHLSSSLLDPLLCVLISSELGNPERDGGFHVQPQWSAAALVLMTTFPCVVCPVSSEDVPLASTVTPIFFPLGLLVPQPVGFHPVLMLKIIHPRCKVCHFMNCPPYYHFWIISNVIYLPFLLYNIMLFCCIIKYKIKLPFESNTVNSLSFAFL